MPELFKDPRFVDQKSRARNQLELAALLQPAFAEKTSREWLAEFDRRGVPCAPIHDFAEVLADEQVAHMGWVEPLTLPNGVRTKTVGFPIGISHFDFEIYRRPPTLGEHTDEVYAEWAHRA
jgi:crotonobetainyl-CoA:carnitine CoA-transferase CaiB-like acyl-CoA transferase